MADDRRGSSRSPRERLSGLVERTVQRQSYFSVISAALAAVLAITLLIDLFVGHRHIDRWAVTPWAAIYVALTVLPLAFGSRYPRWTGYALVAYLTFWSVYSLVISNHPHMELNALLEAPMVAIYMGWFYAPWIARTTLFLHMFALSLAVLLREPHPGSGFSSELTLLYALVIAIFCLEAGTFIRRRAQEEASRDPLTGVLNRRGLANLGKRSLASAEQGGVLLSLAVIDLDDFKEVNDTGGHAAGDAVLKECSRSWVEGLGPEDLVARTGGDEFVLIMHGSERNSEERLAALRRDSSSSWSWGIAEYRAGDDLDSLMLRADAALYRVKESRDR